MAPHLLIDLAAEARAGKVSRMGLKLFHNSTKVSKRDHWQDGGLRPCAEWSYRRRGFFLLLVLVGDGVLAVLAWLLVAMFMR
jgi:hypothetical protein